MGLKYFETGTITNFITSDVVTIAFNYRYLISLAVVPVMLVFMTAIVFIKFSWAAFILPALFMVMVVLQQKGNNWAQKHNQVRLKTMDQRGKLVNEAVSGIKNIKFNAWEDLIKKKSSQLREQETSHNFKYLDIRFVLNGLADLVPVFLNLAIISVYT